MKQTVSTLLAGQRGLALLVAVIFATGLLWAKSRDPFKRTEFSLKTQTGKSFRVILVRPKPLVTRPTVIWLHGAGGKLITDGNDLRQLAELGLNAVAVEYNQTNQAEFDEQFVAMNKYFPRQPWTRSNALAWIGFSQGAIRTLSFVLNHEDVQPQLYVRLAGGLVSELETRPLTNLHCRVLLIHGERDNIFLAADCRKLAQLLRTNDVQVAVRVFADEPHRFPDHRPALMRGIAEYCASFFGSMHPLPVNVRPTYWYYSLPAAVFAILLFLNWNVRWRAVNKTLPDPYPNLSRAVLLVSWLAGIVAVALTMVHLGLPRLAASQTTVNWTRHWLVRTPMQADFDWLANQPYSEGLKVSTLLQHLELADLQKKFFYRDLSPELYRDYVLSPLIEPSSILHPPSSGLPWRRQLWENFYPRIRHETDAASAAPIVVRFLRERMTISPEKLEFQGVESAWQAGIADAAGFETVYVAALRSVGIAARLNSSNQAEFWNGNVWQTTPRPLISSWKDLVQE